MEYVDLCLIHWPIKLIKAAPLAWPKENEFLPLDLKSTWEGMEKCVEMGFTKAIGISNFSSKKIEDLLSHARIPPAVNQVEMHPMWQQKKLRECCSKHNIHVLLRWGIEQGVSVPPKSYNRGRISENFPIFDWCLNPEDHDKIGKIEQGKILRGEEFVNGTTSPYKSVQELWDGERCKILQSHM
ncbi:hypothetical protein KI387_003763, partial [Taxus chinensis]